MAGITSIRFPEATIETPGGSFTVRGLSFSDMTEIVGRHMEVVSAAFAKVMEAGRSGITDQADILAMLSLLAERAPDCLAEIIARAAREPDMFAAMMTIRQDMPFDIQFLALSKVVELTFTTEGGLGKFLETVIIPMLTGTTGLVQSLKAAVPDEALIPSMRGYSESGAPLAS